MMAKVVNEFVDKYTGVLHKKGSTFSCENDRFIEIQKAGNFVEEVKPEKSNKEGNLNNE